MNAQTAVKIACLVGVGALAGAGITYLALNKKYERLLDEEVSDIREHYRKKIEQLNEVAEEQVEKDISKDPRSLSQEEYDKRTEENPTFMDYTSYAQHNVDIPTVSGSTTESMQDLKKELNRVSKAVHDNDFDKHMAEREAPEEDPDEEKEDDYKSDFSYEAEFNAQAQDEMERARNEGIEPYVIGRSEYLNQKLWYEKNSWTIYEDGIITDERDEVVHWPDKYLGPDLMTGFGFDGDDPDICYIRNDQLARDYEVMKTPEKYYGEAHGGQPSLHMSTEE